MVHLRRLNEETLYQHVFERYMKLQQNLDCLKQDLGIHSKGQSTLEVSIEPDGSYRDRETFTLSVSQSLTSLSSSKDNNNSTTGYVLWSTTPFFIKWLLYNDESQVFVKSGEIKIVDEDEDGQEFYGTLEIPAMFSQNEDGFHYVLELGAGVSGILPIVIGNYVDKYVCTDQRGILNILKKNIEDNVDVLNKRNVKTSTLKLNTSRRTERIVQLDVLPLDWEKFSPKKKDLDPLLFPQVGTSCVVHIVAMDVIYNDYLVRPFLLSLTELIKICKQRDYQVKCFIGVQLRAQDVLELFLEQAVIEFELNLYAIEDSCIDSSMFSLYYVDC